MTKGEPGKVLLGFTLPMLGSVIFQQMYNIIDSVVAGKCIGPDALAAVGVSYPITMIFVAIAMGMNVGCSVLNIAALWSKKNERIKNYRIYGAQFCFRSKSVTYDFRADRL